MNNRVTKIVGFFMRSFFLNLAIKTKVNLTIESRILPKAKEYAKDNNISLSVLIATELRKMFQIKPDSFVECVAQLEVPKTKPNIDVKKDYYSDNSEKRGFLTDLKGVGK